MYRSRIFSAVFIFAGILNVSSAGQAQSNNTIPYQTSTGQSVYLSPSQSAICSASSDPGSCLTNAANSQAAAQAAGVDNSIQTTNAEITTTLPYQSTSGQSVNLSPTIQQVCNNSANPGACLTQAADNTVAAQTSGDTSNGSGGTTPKPTTPTQMQGVSTPCMGAYMRVNSACAAQSAAGSALQNAAGAAGNNASSACTAEVTSAIAGMGAAGLSVASCPSAVTSCTNACSGKGAASGTTGANDSMALAQCNQVYTSWKTQMGLSLGMMGLSLAQALNCSNATTNTNDPSFTNPTYTSNPGVDNPGVASAGQAGLQAAKTDYGTGDSGSGSAGGAPGAYPGGAGTGAAAAKDAGGFKDVALGLSNGGGGGGFSGNAGGGGWPGGQKNADGVDLSAFLPGQKRDPAAVGNSQIAKDDGMTIFQHASRSYNVHRPALKPGDKS